MSVPPHSAHRPRRWPARLALACAVVALAGGGAAAAQSPRPGYDVDFIGPPLADPVVQQAKETFVLYGCAYCHGVTLVPRGEATDLRQSALVGRDVNANLLGPLLRAGIPQTAKLSPMPQFSDLSDRQIEALARWIHYARADARYQDLTSTPLPAGDRATGQAAFARQCAGCHDAGRDFAGIGARHVTAAALRAALLRPAALTGPVSYQIDRRADAAAAAGRAQHQRWLENGTREEVAHLVTYLATLK